ncbi:MAG: 3'(2'),5'-bisphosphate nucleotidase CysQ [Gammaproteobacteria bacterium]|nr:3'(2'),5'-bisphosphate nucleotidase CysQ [Gammaproteobacteria bacterium]
MTPTQDRFPIAEVITLCQQAGAAIMEVYRSDFAVSRKDDDSPLTQADMAAHRILCDGLPGLTDPLPVLSEENAAQIDTAERMAWQRYWLVDPLDGTREFINRRDEFTVNVALVENHVATLGVVYAPVSGVTYWGAPAHGAHRIDADGHSTPLQAAARSDDPVRVLGSRSHPDAHLESYLSSLGEHVLKVAGSSLKFCRMAEAAADLYPRFGPTSEWDTAAGQAVAEAAGALTVDLHGQPLRYNTGTSLLNGFFLVYADRERPWLSHVPASLLAPAQQCR